MLPVGVWRHINLRFERHDPVMHGNDGTRGDPVDDGRDVVIREKVMSGIHRKKKNVHVSYTIREFL